jgi:hypothetical protein
MRELAQRLPSPMDALADDSKPWNLAQVNAYLTLRRLCPLKHLGVERDGWKIVRIASSWENLYYSIVEFLVERPDGNRGSYFMKFTIGGDAGRSCVVAAMVMDHLVLVRQNRPTMLVCEELKQSWTLELPREFVVSGDQPTIAGRAVTAAPRDVRSVLGRELGPLFQSGMVTVQAVEQLGDFPEDPGMSSVQVDTWFIQLMTDDLDAVKAVRGTRAMGLRYIPLDDVRRRRRELGITDAHSCTALLALYERLGIV